MLTIVLKVIIKRQKVNTIITLKKIIGKKCCLRQIELTDCTQSYVQWLNDPEINRHLETRWNRQDMESIKDFVQFQRNNDHSILFAIITKNANKHIGNIKIGPIHPHYLFADISYLIGEKSFWNKGIASEAINLACKFGFEELGLRKIEAGAYATAVGSWKALEKNGFIREATLRGNIISEGKVIDVYRYGLLKCEYNDFFMGRIQ